jgi:hypothetical protein
MIVAIRARTAVRRLTIAVITIAMLAVAAPAYAVDVVVVTPPGASSLVNLNLRVLGLNIPINILGGPAGSSADAVAIAP